MPEPKLAPERAPKPMFAPLREPDDENPPREPEAENPLWPMDPPPREPPCIWAKAGTTSAAVHTAAMAHWCRIERIITPLGAEVCQIFSSPGSGSVEKRTAGIASKAERSKGWSRPSGLHTASSYAPGFSPGGASAAEAAAQGGHPCSAKALLHPKSKAAQVLIPVTAAVFLAAELAISRGQAVVHCMFHRRHGVQIGEDSLQVVIREVDEFTERHDGR
jgi:hypothetical protein